MKKKYLIAVCAIVAFLVIFIPLASTNPDGLERVAENFGAHEGNSSWSGVLPDYSVLGLGNGYLSTLIAGVIGVFLVLLVGLLLAKTFKPTPIKTNQAPLEVKR